MVQSKRLISIGYWYGPGAAQRWPDPTRFLDPEWDEDDRNSVASYLRQGVIVQSYMGYSRCRICGENNGDLDLTDGTYVWPDGLVHYVEKHAVRLPDIFVNHVLGKIESLESAEREEKWWRGYA